ncbi:MAG: thaumatin family protein [Gammaproteobacteria bacterium]|nr:thaumatin family protein [Gammaproteobacteria bacterium]
MGTKKILVLAFVGSMFLGKCFAETDESVLSTPTLSVTSTSVVQGMVKASSQVLSYTLSTNAPQSQPMTVHCSFTSSHPALSGSFGANGCTSAGGVGIYSGSPNTVNLTLSASSAASGTITGTVLFQQTNGRKASKTISVPIRISPTSDRSVTFQNYCPFTVALGLASSSVPAKNKDSFHACHSNADCAAYTYSTCVGGHCGGGACDSDQDCLNAHSGTCAVPAGSPPTTHAACTYCASNNDCLAGSACNLSNHQCYWDTPAPAHASTNHYQLAPYSSGSPAKDTVTLTDHSSVNGYALLWGGGFAGRTNCTFDSDAHKFTCKTADCNVNGAGDGNGGCAIGEGFGAPSTQAEATFVSKMPDTYDVTIINGVSVPIDMNISNPSATNPYANPYICGSAGSVSNAVTANGTLGACSWDFTPPLSSLAYRWVDTDDGTTCSSDTACEAINTRYRCGLSLTQIGTSPSAGSASTVCGTALGYWNQNEICATNASFNVDGIVDCTAGPFGGNSMINLLQCTGDAATSCFNVGAASSTCCGCTNWQNQGITVPTNPSIVTQCQYPNSNWGGGSYPSNTGQVLPGLVWLKKACPSAYVYPFDDKSSTFTCPSNNGQSAVNYTVTFCPGGKTAGLPAE